MYRLRKLFRAIRSQPSRNASEAHPEVSTAGPFDEMPTELVLIIAEHLSTVSLYCLSLTCRRLRQTIDLDFRTLHRCEKWMITTRLEQDLGIDEMPKRLACTFCKRKRPTCDFGYRKPLIGEKTFRRLRQVPVAGKILVRFPSLHCRNWYSMYKCFEGPAFNYDPGGRCCYRHDHLRYSSRREKSGKTIPAIGELRCKSPLLPNKARYAAIQVQSCGHCGRLWEDDDVREYGCKHCNCGICRSPERRIQLFRAGEGDLPGLVVEGLAVHPQRKSGEWKVLPLEHGSNFVLSGLKEVK